jgi:O-antigen ligase
VTIHDTRREAWAKRRGERIPERRFSRRPFRWFTPLLGVILCGYMFFGRPFSYLSIPGLPVYPGEIVLAVGLVEAMRVRSLIRPMLASSLPLKVLLAFVALYGVTLVRSLPAYGLDALRDAAVGYYGIYAFLVALAARADPTFMSRLLHWFRKALPWFLAWAPIAVVLAKVSWPHTVPGTGTALNAFSPGDIATFVAMAIAFLWLEVDQVTPRRPSWGRDGVYILIGFVALLTAGSQNRGGFIGALLLFAIVLACMSRGRRGRAVVSAIVSLALVLGITLLLNLRFQLKDRELSVQQVATNLESVTKPPNPSATDEGNLEGNVEWRRQYWRAVYKDAISPRYALTGRGFGPILSYEYGILDPTTTDGQPIRSAHNTHLTVLARTGLPGLALWVALWVTWLLHVARRAHHGHRGGALAMGLLAWLLGAVAAFLFGAYFDPSLDGPKGAIWLYTMVGLGVAYSVGRGMRLPPTPSAILRRRPSRASERAGPTNSAHAVVLGLGASDRDDLP